MALLYFGSLIVLDVVCGNVLLFLLDIKIENRYNRCLLLG